MKVLVTIENERMVHPLTRTTLLLLFVLCSISSAYSQSLNSLKKQNKQIMKELKLKYGLSSINIMKGDGDFWYYLVSKKVNRDKLYGIIDKDNNILFDCEYNTIEYLNGIYTAGYKTYTINSMSGGTDEIRIYNHTMPDHFILAKGNKNIIATSDGNVINDGLVGNIKFLGSWLIINSKTIYTRDLDGYIRLMLINNESKNLGFRTWDGKEIFKNDNFMIYITSQNPAKYNNAYAFNRSNCMGAVYLEDLNSIVPAEYAEIGSLYDIMKFEVKLSPTENFHVYDGRHEKFIPQNLGEKYFQAHDYEGCIKYYAAEGISDPDSKLYTGSSLLAIAQLKVILLKNHIQASVNKLDGYNYAETKGLIADAKTILETAKLQDSLRVNIYQDVINNCDVCLSELETYNSQLQENSFANQLLESVLLGISEGLKQAAINSVSSYGHSTNKSMPTKSNATVNQAARGNSTTTVSKESEEKTSSSNKRKVKCKACGGTGLWINERISGEEKWCDKCGKMRKPHTHKTCGSCDGKGWHY